MTLHQDRFSFQGQIWKQHLKPGDRAIDATCGNGHDTLFLSGMGLSHLYVFDIQKKALEETKKRVGEENISYHLECHSTFPGVEENIELIVYNLGYLPGGDKSITTRVNTTLKSVSKGLTLLSRGGLMTLTLYPGHTEGKREKEALLEFAKTFPKESFEVSHKTWGEKMTAPSMLLIQKAL
ncbi:class I SAM-dependent methyltransferase [Candidatus Neptunochlamydia vexilliferae]|uniref:rRNA methylase YtqB n=1 Tax=Candidatus Neptunichlamydia vexilliferae TaxID=1651774 RepID=A0ABS0AYJ4_9BACT|nr:class I SAM-dependent methyltransferase [Candidatus Neptunochlamydia vexilliferae]MBF5058672.1 putative rRNA methylase YtqB [Candidatus Neptunochlamydia vexilliferae]